MSFRGLPFQFSATNPAERQSELMRRFGVPAEDKMFTETLPTPFSDALSHSSPRLQHRLPGFFANEGHRSEVNHHGQAENVDGVKAEPKVRIVPIQIEGESENQSRHRANSGGASVPITTSGNTLDEEHVRERHNSGSSASPFDSHHVNSSRFPNLSSFGHRGSKERLSEIRRSPPPSREKVCNIPITIEGKPNNTGTKLSHSKTVPLQKETAKRKPTNMGNGPCVSKSASEPSATDTKDDKRQKTDINVSLKQVEAILKEFQAFEECVNEFTEVQNDRRYRYLDEMLTRCMLKLDDIETYGNEEVRKTRKAAVKRVQDSINVLDSKVQFKPEGKVDDEEPVNEEKPSQTENTVTAENANQTENLCAPASENEVPEPKSDVTKAQDNRMEVEISEDSTEKTEQDLATDTVMSVEMNESAEALKDMIENVNAKTLKDEIKESYSVKPSPAVDSSENSKKGHVNKTQIVESNKNELNNVHMANGQCNFNSDENSPNSEIEKNEENTDSIKKVPVSSESVPGGSDVDMKDIEHHNEVSVES